MRSNLNLLIYFSLLWVYVPTQMGFKSIGSYFSVPKGQLHTEFQNPVKPQSIIYFQCLLNPNKKIWSLKLLRNFHVIASFYVKERNYSTNVEPDYEGRLNITYSEESWILALQTAVSDTGFYQCRFTLNKEGKKILTDQKLLVMTRPSGSPQIQLSNNRVIEGTNLTVTCKCDAGEPLGTIFFRRKSSKTAITATLNKFSVYGVVWYNLSFSYLVQEFDHYEQFQCVAYNEITGPTSLIAESGKLIVWYPVRRLLISPRSDVYLTNTRIYCEASGNPLPVLSWRKIVGPESFKSKGAYLQIGGTTGFYLYECLGSNIIEGRYKYRGVMHSFHVVNDGENIIGKPKIFSKDHDSSKSQWPSDKLALVVGGSIILGVFVLAFVVISTYIIWQKNRYKSGLVKR